MVKRVVLAILLLALMGCASKPRIAPTVEGRKEDLLKGLNRSWERLRSMRGRGRIAVSADDRTYSGNFSLLYRNPAELRIDVNGPFGIQLLAVSAVGDSVLAILPAADLAFVSRVSTPGLGAIGDVVTADKLRELATGTVGILRGLEACDVMLKEKDQYDVLVFKDSGYTNEIALNRKTGTIVERDFYDDTGKLVLHCEYGRFKLTRGVLRPYVVMMREGLTSDGLEMIYEHQSLNGRVKESEFHLEIPKGIEVIEDQ